MPFVFKPAPISSDKMGFYYDNPTVAIGDLEYCLGLLQSAHELLEKVALDPGLSSALKTEALELSGEALRVQSD